MYVTKLLLPALTWRGMLSTITCGRVMTVLTTGTLSTGELLQEKKKTNANCVESYTTKYQMSTPKEHHLYVTKLKSF